MAHDFVERRRLLRPRNAVGAGEFNRGVHGGGCVIIFGAFAREFVEQGDVARNANSAERREINKKSAFGHEARTKVNAEKAFIGEFDAVFPFEESRDGTSPCTKVRDVGGDARKAFERGFIVRRRRN